MNIIDQPLPADTVFRHRVSAGSATSTLDKLNRPLRDLRLSVIDQCNFRCTYCMPRDTFGADYSFLPSSERLSFAQIVKLAGAFALLGVEKIRITGGEPLLRRGLESLIEQLAKLTTGSGKPMELALTTYGSLLAAKARSLRDAGLSHVTISLDAVEDAVFRRMSDVYMPVSRILAGIEAARTVGLEPVKVNAVIERGANDSQILPLVRLFKGTGVAARFIEYMDVGGAGGWSSTLVITAQEARDIVESEFPLVPIAVHQQTGTAVNYRHADGAGEVGFVASVSQPFCGSCSRARVSADGKLYSCLFATDGMDLRPWLTDTALVEQLAVAVRNQCIQRDDRYFELRSTQHRPGAGKVYPTVCMSLVGG